MLAIPIDDASTCHLASCLGASLKAGYEMYPYLQGLYKSTNAPSYNHPTHDPTACTSFNKHGMVYVKENTSSLKHLQEQQIQYNVSSITSVPQARHSITNQDGYAYVTDSMKNNTIEDKSIANVKKLYL